MMRAVPPCDNMSTSLLYLYLSALYIYLYLSALYVYLSALSAPLCSIYLSLRGTSPWFMQNVLARG